MKHVEEISLSSFSVDEAPKKPHFFVNTRFSDSITKLCLETFDFEGINLLPEILKFICLKDLTITDEKRSNEYFDLASILSTCEYLEVLCLRTDCIWHRSPLQNQHPNLTLKELLLISRSGFNEEHMNHMMKYMPNITKFMLRVPVDDDFHILSVPKDVLRKFTAYLKKMSYLRISEIATCIENRHSEKRKA